MADFQFVVSLDADETEKLADAANAKTFAAAAKEHERALRETPSLLTKLSKGTVTSGELEEARKSVDRQRELLRVLTDSEQKDEALSALETADETLREIVEAVANHRP